MQSNVNQKINITANHWRKNTHNEVNFTEFLAFSGAVGVCFLFPVSEA